MDKTGEHIYCLGVADGVKISIRFPFLWGLGGLCHSYACSLGHRVDILATDPDVLDAVVIYFWTVRLGTAFISVASVASSAFNAVDRAIRSTWLSLLRSLFLAVPFAFIGGEIGGLRGIFGGLVIVYIGSALLGTRWLKLFFNPMAKIVTEFGKPLSAKMLDHLIQDHALPRVSVRCSTRFTISKVLKSDKSPAPSSASMCRLRAGTHPQPRSHGPSTPH